MNGTSRIRHFVVLGRTATASDDFRLDDLAGTSGRLDVLLRCVRAALLHSHGIRRDSTVDLVLGGGPRAPRVVRIAGASARFIRPDERSLATLLKKSLATTRDRSGRGFVEIKPGVSIANGGLEMVIENLAGSVPFVLDEGGADIRRCRHVDASNVTFFVGDHLGFDEGSRARLTSLGAHPVSVGPVTLHADDVVAIVGNEVDRRIGSAAQPPRRCSAKTKSRPLPPTVAR